MIVSYYFLNTNLQLQPLLINKELSYRQKVIAVNSLLSYGLKWSFTGNIDSIKIISLPDILIYVYDV